MGYFFGRISKGELKEGKLVLKLDSRELIFDLESLDDQLTQAEINNADAVVGHGDTPYIFRIILLKGRPIKPIRSMARYFFRKSPYEYSSGEKTPIGYRQLKKVISKKHPESQKHK